MACCSRCVGYAAAERQFGAAVAQRDLDRYRRKGPDASSRLLLDGVKSVAHPSDSLLDVGAGVGVLSFELLAHGLTRATLVDASPAYLSAARTEAERRGANSRVQCVTGDVVHLAGTVDRADVVVMHRVICCYPDWRALLGRATQLSGRVLAVTYPRELWYVRGLMALENLRRRVFGNTFRTFVHSAAAMETVIVSAAFERVSRRRTPVWCVDVYARRHEASERAT
jgi:2-polyprenyl-3-methyl-5-hydroxy-6-metoxy-1,4-benzoquinol methylase